MKPYWKEGTRLREDEVFSIRDKSSQGGSGKAPHESTAPLSLPAMAKSTKDISSSDLFVVVVAAVFTS